MKYLVNILFVALFIVTVGCNNELIGLDEEINPIHDSEITLTNTTYQEAALDRDVDEATLTIQKDQPNTVVGGTATLTSGGDQDTPEPPGGNN